MNCVNGLNMNYKIYVFILFFINSRQNDVTGISKHSGHQDCIVMDIKCLHLQVSHAYKTLKQN